MENYAVILFALSALGGLTLAVMHFRKSKLPMPLALGHGALGAAGLVCLILSVTGGAASRNAALALVIFVVAALGGFFLFAHHLKKKPLPSAVVVIHALVAVVAFGLLLLGIYTAG